MYSQRQHLVYHVQVNKDFFTSIYYSTESTLHIVCTRLYIDSKNLCSTNNYIILYTRYCIHSCIYAASTYGKDFYIGFMSSIGGAHFTDLKITIGTAADQADYVVEDTDGVIGQGDVSSDSPVSIVLPANKLLIENSNFDSREKGIHIYTTGDETIFVIGENSAEFLNYGVFLAYPCLTFETAVSYEYYVISTRATEFIRSLVLLVGCEDDTTITVTPTESISLPQDPQIADSISVTLEQGTVSHEFSLDQMQTLLLIGSNDLTGTKITSNKPLTVISGHECANVPFENSGCEPFAIHVPPSATWGSNFLLAPYAGRDTTSTYRLISEEQASAFITCGDRTFLASFTAAIYEFRSDEYCSLQSSKPLLVTQFAEGGGIDNKGDPAIAMMSPIDQYVKEITFLTLPSNDFLMNYISITVSLEHYNPASILLDSETISCEWKKIQKLVNGTLETTGYGCNKTVSSKQKVYTQHTVSHEDPNGLLSVIVYGFNSFPARGYAYLSGQRVLLGDGKIIFIIVHCRASSLDLKPKLFTIMICFHSDMSIYKIVCASISNSQVVCVLMLLCLFSLVEESEFVGVDIETLPFVDLTTIPGVKTLDKSLTDASSDPIYIPNGLIFGEKIVTSAYVS